MRFGPFKPPFAPICRLKRLVCANSGPRVITFRATFDNIRDRQITVKSPAVSELLGSTRANRMAATPPTPSASKKRLPVALS